MEFLEIVIYCLHAGIFILSLFFSIKILTATIVLREHWRDQVKRRVYFSRRLFNWNLNILGVLLLILAMYVGWINIRNILLMHG